jgi:hypothetical protein
MTRNHTFDLASAIAAIMTPMVSIATPSICPLLYLVPQRKPTIMVVTLPPLRKMICTGTDILKPKAKLFNMFTVKNSSTLGIHRVMGTVGLLRNNGGCWAEKCAGQDSRVVIKNWTNVMSRPGTN